MAILDELGTRLASQGIASSSGANGWLLALSIMPDSTAIQDRVVALTETAGGPPEARVEIEEPHIQVRVRGAPFQTSSAYVEARAKADEVFQDLHELATNTLSSHHYVGIWALQSPFLLEYDMNDRPHIVCNYRVLRSRTT